MTDWIGRHTEMQQRSRENLLREAVRREPGVCERTTGKAQGVRPKPENAEEGKDHG